MDKELLSQKVKTQKRTLIIDLLFLISNFLIIVTAIIFICLSYNPIFPICLSIGVLSGISWGFFIAIDYNYYILLKLIESNEVEKNNKKD